MCALLAAVALLAIGPKSADAAQLQIFNKTEEPMSVASTGQLGCWFAGTGTPNIFSGTDAARTVPPGKDVTFDAGRECPSRGTRTFVIKFRGPGGLFQDPFALSEAMPYASEALQLDPLRGGRGNPAIIALKGIPGRWLPANPEQSGAGNEAVGLYCFVNPESRSQLLSVTVTDRPSSCLQRQTVTNGPRLRGIADSKPRAPVPVSKPQTVSFFESIKTACRALTGAYAAQGVSIEYVTPPFFQTAEGCNSVLDADEWSLTGVSHKMDNARALNNAVPTKPMEVVGEGEKANFTGEPGSLSIAVSLLKGEGFDSNSCSGWYWTAGSEFSVGGKAGIIDLSGTVRAEVNHNWNDCTTTRKDTSITVSTTDTVTAKPGGTTYLRALQTQGRLDLNYAADLSYGKPSTTQVFTSPATRALGMSAGRVQPCVGFLAGPVGFPGGDPSTVASLGAWVMQHQGVNIRSQDVERRAPELKKLIDSLPNYKFPAGDVCPGWPKGYPASVTYTGAGGGLFKAGATNTTWAELPGGFRSCSWFEERGSSKRSDRAECERLASGTGQPRTVSTRASGAGEVIHGDRDVPRNLAGADGTDLIMAASAADGEELSGGDGFDILEGDEGAETADGGAGRDYVSGGAGADSLSGGAGPDTVLGGKGDDRLADRAGDNFLDGGEGEDVLVTSGSASGGLYGRAGEDRLVLEGEGKIALVGGSGDDDYRLGRGVDTTRAVEYPGGGRDSLTATGRIDVPPEIERVAATDDSGADIRAGLGDQVLIGGERDDRIAGGAGADVLRGQGGDDTLVLGEFGFDEARGGAGADVFVPVTTPPPSLLAKKEGEWDARATAHDLSDFDPDRGDRLVLTASSFGRQVGALKDQMLIREADEPKANGRRPQLLFSRRDGLLRFDRDGRGELPSQVVAILRDHEHIAAAAISIRADDPS